MSDNAREIFAKNLHYIMEARGITQADICRVLDISSATASDWCSGKKYPRVDAMQRLADLLGVRFSALTMETGPQDYADQQRLEALHQDPRLGLLFYHPEDEDGGRRLHDPAGTENPERTGWRINTPSLTLHFCMEVIRWKKTRRS